MKSYRSPNGRSILRIVICRASIISRHMMKCRGILDFFYLFLFLFIVITVFNLDFNDNCSVLWLNKNSILFSLFQPKYPRCTVIPLDVGIQRSIVIHEVIIRLCALTHFKGIASHNSCGFSTINGTSTRSKRRHNEYDRFKRKQQRNR